MTMCTCPECGHGKLSTLARTCPECGAPSPYFGNSFAVGDDAVLIPVARAERILLGHAKGEPLSWLVLDADRSKGVALAVSERVIARHEYAGIDLSWEESDLRTWMVEDFAYGYLSSDEQELIVGEPFILTSQQARLFRSDGARKAWPTAQLSQGGEHEPGDGAIPYWLSTKGTDCGCIQIVTAQGRIYAHGLPPDDERMGVRPAVWIRLAKTPNETTIKR